MSPVRRDWLVYGCLDLSRKGDEESLSQKIRILVSEMYGGKKIGIRSWPQRGFRDTLWWYEKSEIPSTISTYFLKVDNQKSPNLLVGISVEKGYEDKELAQKKAAENKERIDRWLLSKRWDWHRFVSSLNQVKPLIFSVAETLKCELYLSVEFHAKKDGDSKYYVIKDNNLYWRGGFKPVKWEQLIQFVTKPHPPSSWGDVYFAKVFTLNECTPQLDESKIMDVFQAMKPIRDLWRGLVKTRGSLKKRF